MRQLPGGRARIALACWIAWCSSAPPPIVPLKGERVTTIRAPLPRGAEPSVARIVTNEVGPCASASLAREAHSAIAAPKLVDRGEDPLRRRRRVQARQAVSWRG